jgi:hypothetical protein
MGRLVSCIREWRRHCKIFEEGTLAVFLVLRVICFPIFYGIFYCLFVGALVNEVPLHTLDMLYQTSASPFLSILKAFLELFSVYMSLLASIFVPSIIVAKCISYALSIVTIPVLSLLIYAAVRKLLNRFIDNFAGISIYTMVAICLSSVFLSLIPPFCNWRAYALLEVYTPVAKSWKTSGKAVFRDSASLLVPAIFSFMYVGTMALFGTFFCAANYTVTRDFLVRWTAILMNIVVRVLVTVRVSRKVFRSELLAEKKDIATMHMGMGAIILFLVSFTEATVSVCAVLPGCGFFGLLALDAFLFLQKIFVEWFLPFTVLYLMGGLDFAKVRQKRKWAYKHAYFFLSAEIGKGLIFLVVLLGPVSLVYTAFGKGTETATESSQTISLYRAILGFFYAGFDGGCKLVLMGRRLSLPEHREEKARLSYAEITRSSYVRACKT